jgi:ABC-2 type transport system permease protein
MTRLLRAELIKVRTTRTFYALAGAAVGLSVLIVTLSAALSDPTPDSVISDVFQSDLSSLFILILAIVGITGEWRHRTITSSLLAAPDRIKFLAAKTLAFAAAGALLSVAISIAIGIVGYAVLELRDQVTPDIGDLLDLFAHNILVAALLGGIGVGLGSLIRNQPTAIVAVLIFSFVVDQSLAQLAPGVERFSPLGALPNAVGGYDPDAVGMGKVDFLAFGPALALMLVWIGGLYATGAALLRARDVE